MYRHVLISINTSFIEMMMLECNTLLSAPCFSPDSTSFSQSIQQGRVEASGSAEGSPRFLVIVCFDFLSLIYLYFHSDQGLSFFVGFLLHLPHYSLF